MRRGGPVAVRAVRGATQVEVDERTQVLAASRALVTLVMEKNGLAADDVISIVFTATKDVASVAPALAARQLGLHDVALICAQEMWVEDSLPRVVRLLAHVETGLRPAELTNVYLNGTDVLRRDIPPVPGPVVGCDLS
jgi:chorismate mutase